MSALYAAVALCAYGMVLSISATDFYVYPGGTPAGDGSRSQPWDLQTALNHPLSVMPGDTIWLAGGVHRRDSFPTHFTSRLMGLPGAPITVRQIPGERAIIDGSIQQDDGQWAIYWGFEIMNSYPLRSTRETGSTPTTFTVQHQGQTVNLCAAGFNLQAPHVKLINLVIHDVIGSGIFLSSSAENAEIYGVLSSYNGWQGCERGHGHGIYAQNKFPSIATIYDSLFFANFGYGIHAYGVAASVDNLRLEGNAVFSNGVLARRRQSNLFMGREEGQVVNPVLVRNFVYDTQTSVADVDLGYVHGLYNPVLRNNYFQTSVTFGVQNEHQVVEGNTFLSDAFNLSPADFPHNLHLTTRPTTNVVEVRPNRYEPGRAHVIVYNWENLSELSLNLSNVLRIGMAFEVRNACDFFGQPVLSDVYNGRPINLPLTGLGVSKPVGAPAPPPTGPEFSAFIVLPRLNGGMTPKPPVLSPIENQRTEVNTPITNIPLVFSSQNLPAEHLVLSVLSSNPGLVPNTALEILGNSSNRNLTITPADDQVGEAILSLTLSDGFSSATRTFTVTVLPGSNSPKVSRVQEQVTSTPPVTLLPDHTILLRLLGSEPGIYLVEASTNLTMWSTLEIMTLECENGLVDYALTGNPDHQTQFYRLRYLRRIDNHYGTAE